MAAVAEEAQKQKKRSLGYAAKRSEGRNPAVGVTVASSCGVGLTNSSSAESEFRQGRERGE